MKALSQVKFMDVCDVKLTGKDDFSGRPGSAVASGIAFPSLHLDTGALLHEERVIASNSTSKVSLMECGHPGNHLFTCLEKFPGDDHSCEIENTVQPVIGFCFHSSAIKDVVHEAL